MSAPDANGWLPIKEAPRDLRRHIDIEGEFIVLVYDRRVEDCYRVQTAFWNEIIGCWQPCDDTSPNIKPTHFQPRPKPPVTA